MPLSMAIQLDVFHGLEQYRVTFDILRDNSEWNLPLSRQYSVTSAIVRDNAVLHCHCPGQYSLTYSTFCGNTMWNLLLSGKCTVTPAIVQDNAEWHLLLSEAIKPDICHWWLTNFRPTQHVDCWCYSNYCVYAKISWSPSCDGVPLKCRTKLQNTQVY